MLPANAVSRHPPESLREADLSVVIWSYRGRLFAMREFGRKACEGDQTPAFDDTFEEQTMIESCISVIPSSDLEKSLCFWVEGLGFSTSSEMRKDGALVFCMLRQGNIWFMLNQRAGGSTRPNGYEGMRLYWGTTDIRETRERLRSLGYLVSELEERDYGQTEFTLTDDDGFAHCFGIPTSKQQATP